MLNNTYIFAPSKLPFKYTKTLPIQNITNTNTNISLFSSVPNDNVNDKRIVNISGPHKSH